MREIDVLPGAETAPILVTGKDGLRGYLEPVASGVTPSGTSLSQELRAVHLQAGKTICVPFSLLVKQPDGSFFLPLSPEEVDHRANDADAIGAEGTEEIVIPVVAEQLAVGKRVVETGGVRVQIRVQEREEIVDEPLVRHSAVVETVPINRFVEGAIPITRQEGDLLIVPIMEEILVVEKRLLLKEELHIRREPQTFHEPQTVTLRHQEVSVERIETTETPEHSG